MVGCGVEQGRFSGFDVEAAQRRKAVQIIDRRLGRGSIDVLSRAYGKCEVISTGTAGIWWVRYYNSMGVLILNTLEVVDVPVVIKAAPEDLADSAERLKEILEPYWSDVA